jgi:hypothetical protein
MQRPLHRRIRAITPVEFAKMESDAGAVASELLRLFHDHAATSMRAIDALMAAPGYSDESWCRQLYSLSHDLKGLGGSFGYDLVTIVGESLCRQIRDAGLSHDQARQRRVVAHVAALKAIFAFDLKGEGGDDGRALLATLSIADGRA